MAATAETMQRPANPLEGIEDWARRHTRQWCAMCDEFKEGTRQTMLARQPSESELKQHRKGMKMFLRMTRLLHAEVADPDFPDRSLAAELTIRLRQMEDLWEMIHNPIPDDEADKLLRAVFPE
ncbi:MAG: hypothetical protein AAB466_13020 [Verrucomicrobiota bacterium]